MQKNQPSFLQIWPVRIILILWALFIILDYLFHHSYYEKAFVELKYWGLLAGLFLILAGSWYVLFRLPAASGKKIGLKINGLGLYLLLLILMTVIYSSYCSANKLFTASPFEHIIYFVGHTFMLHFFVLLLFLMAIPVGNLILKPLKAYISGVSFNLISLAIGLSFFGMIAVILGLFDLLYGWVLWPLFASGLVISYRSFLPFLKELMLKRTSIRLGWQGLLVSSVLCIFIAINAIGAIKIFPTGFDGASLYMNTSKLIGEYHGLPAGGQAFNWSVIMSFGELLFGNFAVSILLAHLTGILCLIAVFRIGKIFMLSNKALLAAALFYIAPYVTFHNMRDEKVDLGFLFISLTTLLLLLEFYFNNKKKNKPSLDLQIVNWKGIWLPANLMVWTVVGWLTGFAFGIKYIALINFIALMAYLFHIKAGKVSFFGILLLALGAVFLVRVDRFAAIDLGTVSPLLIAGTFLIIGLGTLIFSFRNSPEEFKKLIPPSLLFVAFFALAYAPWGIKHLSENETLNFSSLIQGKSPQPVITIKPDFYGNVDELLFPKSKKAKPQFISFPQNDLKKDERPSAVFVKQESEPTLSAGEQVRREELHRYLGFEKGLPLYLSLPYDLTMSTNFPGHTYLDISFLFLLLFPLLLLSTGKRGRWKNLSLFLLMIFVVTMAVQSVYSGSEGFNSSEAMKRLDEIKAASPAMSKIFGGLYEKMMLLFFAITSVFSSLFGILSKANFIVILFGLIGVLGAVYWIADEKLKAMPLGLKAFTGYLLSFLFFWIFMGNGIPWYAFPALSLLPVLLVYYLSRPEAILGNSQKIFSTYFFGMAFGLFMVVNLVSQFHDHNNGKNAHIFLKTPSVRYAGQQMTGAEVLGKFNPFFPGAIDIVNENLETKVYRVGTFLNYHILKNDSRVYGDNQMGLFDELESNKSLSGNFFEILKDNGFRYIIYDLRTASIDMTPEKSLTKKNQAFVHQLLNSGKVNLRVTDRIVVDTSGKTTNIGGMHFQGVPGLIGKAVYQGSFALFEIK